jgi:hypothetical protein
MVWRLWDLKRTLVLAPGPVIDDELGIHVGIVGAALSPSVSHAPAS